MTVGLIGAGAWGKNLATNLHAMGALAAVAEASPGLREGLASACPGVPLYDDWRPLLESDVPAVAIATPAPTHYEIAREALLAGKDVFVEKPLTLAAAEARALTALADDRGRVLMVGHLLLYQPAIRFLKGYLATGAIGELAYLHQERLNLGRVRAVENVLWSFGVHDVAALLHLIGRAPGAVEASGQRVLQAGVEDDVHLHMVFAGGVQAHLHTSWLWPEKRRRLTVVGTEGMLVYDEADQTVVLERKAVGPDLVARDGGREVVFEGSGEPLRLELEHFLACVAERRTPLSDGKSAVAVLEVLEAAGARLEEKHGQLLRAPVFLRG